MATTNSIEAFRQSWRPTQEKVDLVVKTAIDVARPSRVYVFGSWARGEATPDSDLDLAVFIEDSRKAEISELRKNIRAALSGLHMSMDLIVATEGYVNEFRSSINSIYYQIVHEGTLVYDARHR
jgi:predicted nucleotidyltransferase